MVYCESCKQRIEKLKKKQSKRKPKNEDKTASTPAGSEGSEIPLAQTVFRDKKVCNKCFCDSIISRVRFTMQKVFKDLPATAPIPVVLEIDGTPRSLALYHIVRDSYPPEARRTTYTTSPPRTFEVIPVHVTVPGDAAAVAVTGVTDVHESTFFSEFPDAAKLLEDEHMTTTKDRQNTQIFIRKTLIKCALIFEARRAGALAVLTNETADDLAALVFSDTAMGRGSKVATDACVMDTVTFAPTAVMRPLREFYAEEVRKYLAIKLGTTEAAATKEEEEEEESKGKSESESEYKDMIDGICRDFLRDMQGPFGHTTFAILGSIDRLVAGGMEKQRCTVCRTFIAEIADCEEEDSDLCREFGAPLCRACGMMLKRAADPEMAGRLVAFFELLGKRLN